MGYRIFQFHLGKDRPQAYVLAGDGEHEGTNETVSYQDVMAHASDGTKLAAFLDYRFLRAHREQLAAERATLEGMQAEGMSSGSEG